MATKEVLFNNNIREHLDRNGMMMQYVLAEKVGISKQSMGAIILGKTNPTLETAMKIAKVFNVSVEEVFQLKNE